MPLRFFSGGELSKLEKLKLELGGMELPPEFAAIGDAGLGNAPLPPSAPSALSGGGCYRLQQSELAWRCHLPPTPIRTQNMDRFHFAGISFKVKTRARISVRHICCRLGGYSGLQKETLSSKHVDFGESRHDHRQRSRTIAPIASSNLQLTVCQCVTNRRWCDE